MALISVLVDGTPGEMDEVDLIRINGEQIDDNGTLRWVQYHLKTNGGMVHRSVDIELSPQAMGILANL